MELRKLGYEILKKVFYMEPDIEFINAIIDSNILEEFPFRKVSLSIEEGVGLAIEELKNNERELNSYHEKLHWDYTKMFIGPNYLLAPPWESTYFNDSRLLFQEQTFKVRETYLKYNFIPKNYPYEPDDHIGCELDFMNKLSSLSLDMIKLNNEKRLRSLLDEQQSFISEHLKKWIDMFVENIEQFSETDFYRGFALILKGFIAIDKEILEELISDL